MVPIENLIGEKNNQISMLQVPLDKISFYACEDADITLQIYNIQKTILIDKKLDDLFFKVEMPLIKVLVNMEFNGVYIDKDIINNLCIDFKASLEILSNKIYMISDRKFNINSPKQLAEILFDELELKMFKKRSTSVEVLKKLLKYHPIAELILEYRHLNKLVNTYLEKLPKHINPKTDRIHTSFNQAIASTGRLSSTKPNFQNIPIKTDVGKSIRKAFKSNNNDDIIISFDYSQIELRILAHYSNEKKLIEAFENNIDIHTRTAALIYGISNEDVEYNHRRVAKMVNYSIAYGAGPFRISEELKISIKEASSIINNYFERYPGIKKYIDDIIIFGLEYGYVKTILGRQRNTLNLKSSNRNIREAEKRAAINMPIQGTASELIKIAMIKIDEEINRKKMKSKMILQVHDELLFEVPLSEKNDLIDMVARIMENSMKFKVPIKVDCNFGNNWYEAH
jgi:DNA polymerase-1